MKEIELKARVSAITEMEKKIQNLACFRREVHKSDYYFDRKQTRVRIRHEQNLSDHSEVILFTQKNKLSNDSIEINDENEFELLATSVSAFRHFLKAIGFQASLTKEKHSKLFTPFPEYLISQNFDINAQCHIELVYIPQLGHFIEIEVLLPDQVPDATINKTRAFLYQLCQDLSIKQEALEARWYSDLLAEAALG